MLQHGSEIISTVKDFSAELDLSLDFTESTIQRPPKSDQPSSARKTDQKVTPAKEEAWKMWQQQGLSISVIAVHALPPYVVVVSRFTEQ